ncbi:MAG: RIO1 family regulatory kinase/ATPase [Trueperaceae bacterium]
MHDDHDHDDYGADDFDADGFDADVTERFRGRKVRRPQGRARLRDVADDDATDPGLARLREIGLLHDVVGELKSGKEADVLLARGPDGLLALKVYRDPDAGGYRPDAVYLDGRRVPRGRLKKVLDRGARSGLPPELALWVLHEASTLWAFEKAGVPVPTPLVGPGAYEIAQTGRVLPMAFIGDPDGTPAPRLADVALTHADAADAWRQAQDLAVTLLRSGWVHGDLSAWNLLRHDGRLVVIDVPQAVRVDESPHAAALFSRDVHSLLHSVAGLGIEDDPVRLEAELRTRAGLPPTGPFPF